MGSMTLLELIDALVSLAIQHDQLVSGSDATGADIRHVEESIAKTRKQIIGRLQTATSVQVMGRKAILIDTILNDTQYPGDV